MNELTRQRASAPARIATYYTFAKLISIGHIVRERGKSELTRQRVSTCGNCDILHICNVDPWAWELTRENHDGIDRKHRQET